MPELANWFLCLWYHPHLLRNFPLWPLPILHLTHQSHRNDLHVPQVLSSPHLPVPLPRTLYLFPLNLLNFYLSFKTQIRHHLLQEILLNTPPTWSQIAHLHTGSVQISYHLKKYLKDEVPLHLELNARGKIHSPKNCRK